LPLLAIYRQIAAIPFTGHLTRQIADLGETAGFTIRM
jgi:hypothetical protein